MWSRVRAVPSARVSSRMARLEMLVVVRSSSEARKKASTLVRSRITVS
jgi:hypothetical protein